MSLNIKTCGQHKLVHKTCFQRFTFGWLHERTSRGCSKTCFPKVIRLIYIKKKLPLTINRTVFRTLSNIHYGASIYGGASL